MNAYSVIQSIFNRISENFLINRFFFSSSGKSNVQQMSANDSGTSPKISISHGATDTSQLRPDSHASKCLCDSCWTRCPTKDRKKKVMEEDEDIRIVSKKKKQISLEYGKFYWFNLF
jgi:hypothetical protein